MTKYDGSLDAKQVIFSECCSIFALSGSFEFEFPAITLSQLNYCVGCFVVGVVVVVGL